MTFKDLKVGDKLWLEYTTNRARRGARTGFEIEVLKVGRLWGHFKDGAREYRFSLATGVVDAGGYTSWAQVYFSKEAFEAEKRKHKAWARLTSGMRHTMYRAPAHLTEQDILGVCNLLGIPE